MSIEIHGLVKSYDGRTVLHRVSFAATAGRVTGFLGPNGSGKSTTLRCLLGLSVPDDGQALIDGRRYVKLRDPARVVGASLNPFAHHPDRTGRQHLRVMCDAAGLPASRAEQVLVMVELTGAADRRAGEYSLGMRQRLHLAGAMLGDPAVIVLDEPANGLDPAGVRWLRDTLRMLAGEGRTVLLSSHQLPEVQQTVDDVVVIAAGRIVACGTLREVLGGDRAPVLVRSADTEALDQALQSAGFSVKRGPGTGSSLPERFRTRSGRSPCGQVSHCGN